MDDWVFPVMQGQRELPSDDAEHCTIKIKKICLFLFKGHNSTTKSNEYGQEVEVQIKSLTFHLNCNSIVELSRQTLKIKISKGL